MSEEEAKKQELKAEKPKPKPSMKLKSSEWAKSDPDKPDPHLFLWWDKKGAIPKNEYNEIKTKVYRKQ